MSEPVKHQDFGERVEQLMKQKQVDLNDVADATGISYEMVRRYKDGIAKPREKGMQKLADYFGVSIAYMGFGNEGFQSNGFVDGVAKKVREIPVLTWVQAGIFNETGELEYDRTEPAYDDDYPDDVYWIRVKGDSMEPRFFQGDLLLIDPNRQAKGGDFVIAREEFESNSITFKKLRSCFDEATGRDYYQLIPLNKDYAIVDSRFKNFVIQGVVIEKKEVLI
ncbi:LexA family transcriptional regulator [Moraxella bovis]|uniref:LexA family transcriptional regulator n=1 Tax=Moraxella bovis TaxID=476 RepID=A0AAX3EYV4_MORBO|nr:LexA family transcriptional regulator [Moraxella bovis]AWY20090.1 hypothetical protein DQF64_05975 [Moraxella bovis]UYZ74764.1 LexA family transcriptional regulator [Moraxella bovis]UYZ79309.1 LexA family transcriptional regulator [Moraxella bovis]UYZ80113.1 LexA family transcriptional regulator [Moraxella bovis]UYZ87789.1 LexA family transcriptional regulator [Moraxella bovis]